VEDANFNDEASGLVFAGSIVGQNDPETAGYSIDHQGFAA
jgi:hypothetical protein